MGEVMGNRDDHGPNVGVGSEGRYRPRLLAAVVMTLGVMIAACGHDSDSDTSAGDVTSTSRYSSSDVESSQEDAETVMIEIARGFSAAADAADFESALGFFSEEITVLCYGEENFQGRSNLGNSLPCWPGRAEPEEFAASVQSQDTSAGSVSWFEVRSDGLTIERNLIEATISEDLITSLSVTYSGGETIDPRDSSLPLATWRSDLEAGQVYRYNMGIHCGLERVEFNDTLFMLVEAPQGNYSTGGGGPRKAWPIDPNSEEVLGYVTLVDENTVEYALPSGEVIGIFGAVDEYVPETCA